MHLFRKFRLWTIEIWFETFNKAHGFRILEHNFCPKISWLPCTYAYFPSKKYAKKFYQRNLKKSALVVKARKKSLYPYNFVAPYNS